MFSNVCFGFDIIIGWIFFDFNEFYDEYKDEFGIVVEVDFVSYFVLFVRYCRVFLSLCNCNLYI